MKQMLYYLRVAGAQHKLRADFLIKLLRGEEAKCDSSFLECCSLPMRLLGTFRNVYQAR